MNTRAKKTMLLALAAGLLFGSSQIQKSLNADRDRLGMTYAATLDNAPPLLAFTTVAMGGFRGLISNFLWIRANELQQDDKFFEAAQLANWITDLEPHFPQVWLFQGWNMAYNVSVKFKENKAADENGPADYSDRWRWVQNGIELLRDRGLKYNPNSVLIFRELAWLYQDKMGGNLDDANMFYKQEWARAMEPYFGAGGTNFDGLISPVTGEERTNAMELREKYKLDPEFVRQVDQKYGPLDWRLPEAHAIYWGAKGLDEAKKNPAKVKAEDLVMLRRIIYQSLYQAFKHGRIVVNPITHNYSIGPNLELINRVNDAYVELAGDEDIRHENIQHAQRNFLRDAVYFLYEANRMQEARQWYAYLGEHFPNMPILDDQPTSLPRNLTLDEYAVARVQDDIGTTSQERVTAALQGLLAHAYMQLAAGDDDSSANLRSLARHVYERYISKTGESNSAGRLPLPPYADLNQEVVQGLLDPQTGMPYAARAALRTQLGMPAEATAPVPDGTPATVTNPPPAGATNPAAK